MRLESVNCMAQWPLNWATSPIELPPSKHTKLILRRSYSSVISWRGLLPPTSNLAQSLTKEEDRPSLGELPLSSSLCLHPSLHPPNPLNDRANFSSALSSVRIGHGRRGRKLMTVAAWSVSVSPKVSPHLSSLSLRYLFRWLQVAEEERAERALP